MPATFLANSFRNPLGNGLTSPENDGDGFYVAFGFDEPNPDIGGSRHLGVDWNGEGGGNTDLGAPVHAIGNGIVVAVISNQGTATTGFGNYIVLRHDLPEPTLINGQWVTQVHSLYAHLDTVSALSVGQQLGIGTQIGTLGRSGYADVAHLHLEITIGNVLPTDDDGYNPSGAPSGWVDPVAFVNERLSAAASTTNTDMLTAARFGIAAYSLAGNESPMSGSDRANSAASTEYTALQGEGWRYLTSAEAGLTTLNSGAVGEAAGFFVVGNAAALVAVRDNTLVLSFRGTNDTGLTPGTDHWDWVHRDVHFNNFADTFLDQLRSYLSSHSEITEVLVTGHSLGAAMVDALFMSSWDLRNLRPSSLDVVGINFADPGYQLGSDVGAASSDLTTLNFNEDVINFASDFSDLAGDFTRIFTPDSGTSWTTYHSMQGYLSLVSYMTDLGITADQVNAFNGTFFVNGVVAPCGQAFIVAQYGSRISPNGDQNNFFVGGLGSDEIYGGAYSDTLIGGGGNDDLRGLDSADLLRGSDGNDVLYGGLSHDYLWGEDDNDLLRGESGNDFLYGGDGADDLRGDGGLDRLEGGSGADKLAGGLASDVFSFADDDFPLFQSVNPDQITDYNRGAGTLAAAEGDVIDLSGINFATSNGSGSTSTVRLRSIEASGGLPAGAILEINIGDDIWRGIARLDGVGAGEAVRIALTDAQSAARTGSTFVVDAVGNGTTWSISPATRNVSEGNVTISFTITRSGANLGAETVYVSTAQTQGFYNDGDYVGRLNVPVVFAAGDLSETFTVRINADAVPEGDETFGVIVQSDSRDSASIFLASATFTIQDGAPPTVSGSNYIGDSLDNIWSGTSGQDLALGMGGNDRLTGGGGNDILSGGDGDDSLYGGGGNDIIVNGDGTDYVDSGAGNDYIDARQVRNGRDTVLGGSGDDTILAGSANNGVYGDTRATIDGGTGEDLLVLEARSDGNYTAGQIRHQFGSGPILDANTEFTTISEQLAETGTHLISSGLYSYS
ncbi:peptidoglycan DD-metalloendopeptidase family protein, partial [Roseicitreum antarcticum]